jgi:hypothetical protein
MDQKGMLYMLHDALINALFPKCVDGAAGLACDMIVASKGYMQHHLGPGGQHHEGAMGCNRIVKKKYRGGVAPHVDKLYM